MAKRKTYEIKKSILMTLKDGESHTLAELERSVNTNWYSIKNNCVELKSYGAVEMKKKEKHEATGRPYFSVKITKNGRKALAELEK